MEEIKETTYKGTRILLGNDKRAMIDKMIKILIDQGYQEIMIPVIQLQETFANKVGEENTNMMFNFKDRGDRNVCLAPEYTAVIQKLSKTIFKYKKDIKVFYVQECFRGERPQAGRYRQFTQLGVEIINPSKDYYNDIVELAEQLVHVGVSKLNYPSSTDREAVRGLDYYKNGKGFEITCEGLGTSKQICGGGEYDGGIGFAIGIDRILK